MTAGEIIDKLRQQLADTEEPYLWDNTELLFYLDLTLKEIYTKCKDVIPDTTYSFQTEEGVAEYPINGEIFSIRDVICDRVNLTLLPISYYFTLNTSFTGKPTHYSIMESSLFLYPTPDNTYEVIVFQTFYPFGSIAVSTDIPLAFNWYDLIASGMLWRAYLKDDSEAFSQKAGYYEAKYKEQLLTFRSQMLRENQNYIVTPVHPGLL